MEKLAKLKKDYEKLQNKHKLPDFNRLNEEFEIEKLQERETDFLLRNIRRAMVEKIAVVLRFLEVIVNPTEGSAPLYIFSVMKNISSDTKKIVEKVYGTLTAMELNALALDIQYDEKKEVVFINEISKEWSNVKKHLIEITEKLEVVWSHEKSHDGYFG